MIRLIAFGLLALAFLFSCRVFYRLEKKRLAAERPSAMEDKEAGRWEALAEEMRDQGWP